jgi:hypothetical protein
MTFPNNRLACCCASRAGHLGLLAAVAALACATGPKGFEPVRFEAADRPAAAASYPNWPVPPEEAMALMKSRGYDIRVVERTQAGTSGAEKFNLGFEATGKEVDFKVKRMPPDLDGVNNSPRRELAAFAVQTLFLDPEDYVVPTTAARCPPMERWHELHGGGEPQLLGSSCMLVVAALWLNDVVVPEIVYDKERFLEDPVYARYLADLNLFTYLVDHRDGRSGNILVSKEEDRRHVFAIDNGISFGPTWPFYNWFVPNWNVLRVAALRKDSVERLRRIERADLDALLVVQELRDDGTGHYVDVEPGPPLDEDGGAVARDGIVQFGLTDEEIEDLWRRIRAVIEKVDQGDIPVF